MYINKLLEAKAEAERFLKKIDLMEKDMGPRTDGYLYGSKHTGAIKRSSMDLTRALADLRKS